MKKKVYLFTGLDYWTGVLNWTEVFSFFGKFLCLFLKRTAYSFKLTSSYLISIGNCNDSSCLQQPV